jgi:hypothetical protein
MKKILITIQILAAVLFAFSGCKKTAMKEAHQPPIFTDTHSIGVLTGFDGDGGACEHGNMITINGSQYLFDSMPHDVPFYNNDLMLYPKTVSVWWHQDFLSNCSKKIIVDSLTPMTGQYVTGYITGIDMSVTVCGGGLLLTVDGSNGHFRTFDNTGAIDSFYNMSGHSFPYHVSFVKVFMNVGMCQKDSIIHVNDLQMIK